MMENTPTHSRIHYLQGDSTAKSSIEKIKTLMEKINPNNDKKIMVIFLFRIEQVTEKNQKTYHDKTFFPP